MKPQIRSKASALALSLLLAGNLTPAVAFADDADTASQPAGIVASTDETGNAAAAGASTTETADNAATASNAIEEPAADVNTTVPNNVDTVVPSDDKQGTDISYKANAKIFGMEIPVADTTANITTDDAKSGKTLDEVSSDFAETDFGKTEAGNLVVKGDMAIKDDGTYDTTKDAAHNVKKDSKHDVKAELDVTAIHESIEKSASLLYGGAAAANAVYVNNLETGLRATFSFGNDLNGEFYVPTTLEDAQAHYVLASADGNPLIFRINYGKSSFKKDKVIVAMDLDLTKMTAQKSTYDGSSKTLYGNAGIMENFRHTDAEYGSTYDTSTFGNFKQLITSSAKRINLTLKDVLFRSATGNPVTTETDEAITTTTQGSLNGTLVGYMKADVGHNRVKGNVSYVWGAMQNADGKDVNAAADSDNVTMTTQFTETTPKPEPDNPSKPDTPNNPNKPDNPGTHESDHGNTANTVQNTDSNIHPAKATAAPAEQPAQAAASETTEAETTPQLGDSSTLSVGSLLAMMGAAIGVIAVALRRRYRRS